MDKPKEMWVFNSFALGVIGPCEIIGESADGSCWRYKRSDYTHMICLIHKDRAISTRKQAVEACYKYHEKEINQEQKKLDERMRLLKKFYSEELYG